MKFLSKFRTPVTPEEKKQRRKDWLLLILSGIILGISFPPFPFPFTLLIFIGLGPYFIVLKRRATLASISRATFIFGFVFSLVTIYWVGSWSSEADPFLMMSGVALLLAYPCVMMIPSTLFYLAKKVFPKFDAIWLFPIFWVTFEYLLSLTDLRFPWLLLGHGLAKFNLFIQGADIIGTFGLSLTTAYINVLIYKSYIDRKQSAKYNLRPAIVASVIFLVFLIYGIYKVSSFKISDRNIKVGIVQPDLNPWDKWEKGNLNQLLNMYLDLSQECANESSELIQNSH